MLLRGFDVSLPVGVGGGGIGKSAGGGGGVLQGWAGLRGEGRNIISVEWGFHGGAFPIALCGGVRDVWIFPHPNPLPRVEGVEQGEVEGCGVLSCSLSLWERARVRVF